MLIIFDEILKKGFDGHIFINGLASHFRDLLVCKDPQTLVLLETSESIKDRYQQQAKAAPVQVLIQALELYSRCDVSYKASKNQRLLVELTLMQACSLDPQGEKKNLN